jgi:hypothetical protein
MVMRHSLSVAGEHGDEILFVAEEHGDEILTFCSWRTW